MSAAQRVERLLRMTRGRLALSLLIAAFGLPGASLAQQAKPNLATQAKPSVAQLDAPVSTDPGALPPVVVAPPMPAAGSLEERVMGVLQIPNTSPASDPRAKLDREDIAGASSFYAARTYAPLWVSGTGYTPKGLAMIAELQRAGDWGLSNAEYVVPVPQNALDQNALAFAEITLTKAVLRYARHARGGRIPDPSTQLSSFIDRKPQLLAPATVLEQVSSATSPGTALTKLHPQHAGFERLRLAYLKARDGAAQAASLMLPPGPTLMVGTIHPDVAALRRRLKVAAPTATNAELYDDQLVVAVTKFQTEAGLRSADGKVGDKTRQALNAGGGAVTTASLLANMEQWRWMPENLGAIHVTVNIPEFTTRVVKNGTVVHSERVVTGKLETATPIFSQAMETVVFQPQWGVPESIKVNELLPRLQSGRGLGQGLKMTLNGRDIDPWNVDWNRADIRRYTVFQPSGDDNALGVVKFLFPNKHSVYLHDTPSKTLFNSASRAFSHGCIRVRNPVRLAELVLGNDKGWTPERVRNLVEDGPEDNAVKLDTKVPVHITYFTAVADEAGTVQSFADVYGHERRIALALDGKSNLIAKLEPAAIGSAQATDDGNEAADEQRRRTRRAAAAPAPSPQPTRRRSAEVYYPPAALGYSPPPPKKSFWQPRPSNRGYRGNSTNDVIMRQLGGF
jgi:L,D-transpeptidase YcbB